MKIKFNIPINNTIKFISKFRVTILVFTDSLLFTYGEILIPSVIATIFLSIELFSVLLKSIWKTTDIRISNMSNLEKSPFVVDKKYSNLEKPYPNTSRWDQENNSKFKLEKAVEESKCAQ